ncbi:transposase (plasmid) [Klebsiella pneumoniae]|nr:transposase [Klebsiella pneumoniae]APP49833.1 transposase [Klebsiella pneumoniae]APP55828.1 transposase [Klebsiella pneumoniae]APP61750.1 transposase [Klebsiella pneumoniae]APP67545.1 transposase [Klebsiella pneumoniae]
MALPYPLSASILSNSKHLFSRKTSPYIPALKDGDIRRIG